MTLSQEFVDNVMSSQPKLAPQNDGELRNPTLQHIFPLRDWKTGALKKAK